MPLTPANSTQQYFATQTLNSNVRLTDRATRIRSLTRSTKTGRNGQRFWARCRDGTGTPATGHFGGANQNLWGRYESRFTSNAVR